MSQILENRNLKRVSEIVGERQMKERSASTLAKVKPVMAVDFDGNREKGHAFFNTCCIYFTVIGDLFLSDQSQIHWVLSFFKSDQAACFANKVLQSKSKGKGHYFQNWEAFEKAFLDQFCPKNGQLTALTKLEGTSWYQGKVDDYID